MFVEPKTANNHPNLFCITVKTFLDCTLIKSIYHISFQGRSQRCFKGHNIPVTTLADRLLGVSGTKLLASGGEDGSVRLWSMGTSVKRQPLVATFHGHERPVSLLTVAGYARQLAVNSSEITVSCKLLIHFFCRHNPSLLVSISKDGKV